MAHFDAVLPGRVHRVFYEDMVEDTETEVRRLLDYCGLPFEPRACASTRTSGRCAPPAPSRCAQPIYREGIEQWRHFEPWLGPLKAALGPVLESYPQAPDFVDNHHTAT